MPGKVNPVIPEVVLQVAAQVIGNDTAITIGGMQGKFELNVRIPLIARNLLVVDRAADQRRDACSTRSASSGIQANRAGTTRSAESTLAVATALNPYIGYDRGDGDRPGGDPLGARRCARSRASRASTRSARRARRSTCAKIALAATGLGAAASAPDASSSRSSSSCAPRLRERLVEVAALRRLHARGAAVAAAALADQAVRVGDELLEAREGDARDADAAGVAVVDEDRRPAGLRVGVGREAADVPAVAHREQRQHRDLRVLGGVQRAEQQLRREAGERRRRRARTTAPAWRSASAAARARSGRSRGGRAGRRRW